MAMAKAIEEQQEWTWTGRINHKDKEPFLALITASMEANYVIQIFLCNSIHSFTGSLSLAVPQNNHLAPTSPNRRITAIRDACFANSHTRSHARIEEDELRISAPWGGEYEANIDLDVDSIKLTPTSGSEIFLSAIFGNIAECRKQQNLLNTKAQSLQAENDNLEEATKILHAFMNARPKRLGSAAKMLNQYKNDCRSAK